MGRKRNCLTVQTKIIFAITRKKIYRSGWTPLPTSLFATNFKNFNSNNTRLILLSLLNSICNPNFFKINLLIKSVPDFYPMGKVDCSRQWMHHIFNVQFRFLQRLKTFLELHPVTFSRICNLKNEFVDTVYKNSVNMKYDDSIVREKTKMKISPI